MKIRSLTKRVINNIMDCPKLYYLQGSDKNNKITYLMNAYNTDIKYFRTYSEAHKALRNL